jgi:cation diffusion facilitator CzcD-associated flavoprotein CzcO
VRTDLLIIGAGPYGLALAAYARHLGVEHLVVGRPMAFWTDHMPSGMYLRSASDWSLDPLDRHSIPAFLETRGQRPRDVEPLSRALYLAYARWFQAGAGIEPHRALVRRLDAADGPDRFAATTDAGEVIRARSVVIAVGFKDFAYVPPEIADRLPSGRYTHTCDLVDLAAMAGRRCLVVGGRQSAYEWTALASEAGAAAVHVSHRHDPPAFAPSDWSWVAPLVDAMVDDPGWFRRLPVEEQEAVHRRLWAEGRLKVEPWLAPRVSGEAVRIWPRTQVAGVEPGPAGALAVALDPGPRLVVDHVILATGYRVRIEQVPFLARGNLLAGLRAVDGYPVLNEQFETSVPGLFITSMPAVRDFGPFFAFTVAVRASARIIGREVDRRRRAARHAARSA